MNNKNTYQRQRVGGFVIKVLQDLDGRASKQKIKEELLQIKKN